MILANVVDPLVDGVLEPGPIQFAPAGGPATARTARGRRPWLAGRSSTVRPRENVRYFTGYFLSTRHVSGVHELRKDTSGEYRNEEYEPDQKP